MTFAAALRQARLRHDWSCGVLSRRAGTDASTIARLEAGQRHPSRALVRALANALALTADARADLFIAAGYWPDHWRPDFPAVLRQHLTTAWQLAHGPEETHA